MQAIIHEKANQILTLISPFIHNIFYHIVPQMCRMLINVTWVIVPMQFLFSIYSYWLASFIMLFISFCCLAIIIKQIECASSMIPTYFDKCLNFTAVFKSAWYFNRPWKLAIFLKKNTWKWLIGLKNNGPSNLIWMCVFMHFAHLT